MKINKIYDREEFPISHGSWQNRWKVSITNNKIRWTIKTDAADNNGVIDLDSETEVKENTYYNVCVTYNGDDVELWIDGSLDAFTKWNGKLLTTDQDMMIGQMLPGNTSYNFDGVLDDIRIYDFALSVKDIQNLYQFNTEVHSNKEIPVANYYLSENYPNPFNSQTIISYQVKNEGKVSIVIYDILGRKLKTLVSENKNAGNYTVRWDGLTDSGASVSSGIYICSMTAQNFSQSRKLVYLK